MENLVNGYEMSEKIGREKAIKLLGNKANLVMIEDRFAPYDVSGTTISSNFYIEIKDRKCKSDAYDSDILEYSKLSNMRNVDPKGIHYYLCFFTDGVARLYHLNKILLMEIYISKMDCPVTSVENNGIKEKIMMQLPHHLAKEYKY